MEFMNRLMNLHANQIVKKSGYCYLLALSHQLSGHVACEFHYLGMLLYWIWKTGWDDPFQ
ncbi:hypothetical protein Hanom_Chr08g00690051 [Helianthus anomalus]